MAKKDKAKKDKAKKAEKAETKSEAMKYGVEDLANILDIKPASARVQLRNHGVEKAGKSYGWNTKAELEAVADQIKSSKGDDDGDDKPKKSKKAKKGKKSKK